MDLVQVVLLALIQGITEFLPISSSAHLILPSKILGWPDQGLEFDVAVHVGTLCAVVFYFKNDLWDITRGWFAQFGKIGANENSRLAWAIIVGTIPVCVAGYLGNDFIKENLRSTLVIATTTIVFGLLLWWADSKGKQVKTMQNMTLVLALIIGGAQVLALIPGTSRSGITITVALILGLTRKDSARFSFLLSIPTILLSGAYETLKLLGQVGVDWLAMGVGFVVSGVSAYLCIYLFLNAISRMGMLPFVIYRLILGVALFAIWFST